MFLSFYFVFVGNCVEVIVFYQQMLGVELMFKMIFGEMLFLVQEVLDGCLFGQKMVDDVIVYVSLCINNGELMLSDSVFGFDVYYVGFIFVFDFSDVVEGQCWFDVLVVGGCIEMVWQEIFWVYGFGKVVDCFGVFWMINVVK